MSICSSSSCLISITIPPRILMLFILSWLSASKPKSRSWWRMSDVSADVTRTPCFLSSAASFWVTTLYGISISSPSSMDAIFDATSASETIRFGLNHLDRVTLLDFSPRSFVLTGPLCHFICPTESLAYWARYPLVSSLNGTSPSTTTRLSLLYAELNWSLSGEFDVWKYGLYAACIVLPFALSSSNFPPLRMSSGRSLACSHAPISLGDTKVFFPSSVFTFAAIGGYNFPSITCIAL